MYDILENSKTKEKKSHNLKVPVHIGNKEADITAKQAIVMPVKTTTRLLSDH